MNFTAQQKIFHCVTLFTIAEKGCGFHSDSEAKRWKLPNLAILSKVEKSLQNTSFLYILHEAAVRRKPKHIKTPEHTDNYLNTLKKVFIWLNK